MDNERIEQNEKAMHEDANAAQKAAEKSDDFADSVEDAGKKAEDASNGGFTVFKGILSDLATNAIMECADAAKELAASIVQTGMDFESSLSKVEALSGATEEEMELIKEKAEEMGKTTSFTAKESADAFSYMALAGWNTSEMLEGIEGILDLAAASEMDLATASDIVTDNLSAFGLTAKESTRLADQMAYAMSHSNTSTEQLGEAWKNVAATSTQLGYSLEDTTAALMVMADSGIKGGEAGTALSSIMTRLGNNVSDCRDVLAEYGIEIYDSEGNVNSLSNILQGMQDVWADLTDEQKANLSYVVAGKTAQSELMTVLGETTGSFDKYKAGLLDCSDAAAEMSETMLDNLSGDITLMESGLDGLKIKIFDSANSPLRTIVQTITNSVLPAVDSFIDGVGEVCSIFSSLKDGTDVLYSALSNTFGEETATTITNIVESIGNTIGGLKDAFSGLGNAISSDAEGSTVFSDAFGIMAEGISAIWFSIGQPVLDALSNGINWIAENWPLISETMSSCFQTLWDVCSTVWTTIGQPIWDMISYAVGSLAGLFAEHMPAIMEFFQTAIAGISDTWNNHLKPVFDAIGTVLNESVKPAFEFVWQTIVEPLVTNVFGTLADLWNNMLKPVFDGICDFLLGVFTNDWKAALLGILNIVTGIFGGIVTAIETPMNVVKDIVNSAIDFICEKFDFDWSFPPLKLPHFKISGSFSLNPPSAPSFDIQWYKNGGIMTQPTIFGMNGNTLLAGGEAGMEAVLPISILEEYINNSMAQFVELIPRIDYELLGESVAQAIAKNPTRLIFREREVGRIIQEYV